MTDWPSTEILDRLSRVLVAIERDAAVAAAGADHGASWRSWRRRASGLACDAIYARMLLQVHTSLEVMVPHELNDIAGELPALYETLVAHFTGDSTFEAMTAISAVGAVLEEVRHLGLLPDAA